WLEVTESVECLKGTVGTNDHSADLMEVTHVLSGAMLMLGKKAATIEEGITLSKEAVANGKAYQKFVELVKVQGGNVSAIENLQRYPLPLHTLEVKADADGSIVEIDALELGLTAIMLGAGRETLRDAIDHKAGIVLRKKVGDPVEMGDTVAVLHTDREHALEPARKRAAHAFVVSHKKPEKEKLILNILSKDGVEPWAE
ncbi:MAG: thymidine phosphorylase, partial [Bacteroidota bacterium]